jgi:formate hydrogenlyase subunit 3/multisubunit Na+/H+ antiporter MnhD subunit
MLNGIVLLLGTNKMPNKAGSIQSLSLLFAAFVTLGLDAYLFGLVTGDSTKMFGRFSACRRAWTEATLAAGFVFLFTVYLNETHQDKDLRSSMDLLAMLCGVLRAGVALVVVAVLFMTVRSYWHAIFPGEPPVWDKAFTYAYLAIGVTAVFAFGVAISAPLRDPAKKRNWLMTKLRADDTDPKKFIRALRFAIYSSLGYSVLTVIAATVAAASPAFFWNPAHAIVKVLAFLTVVWASFSLIPVLLLTGRAVPAFQRHTDEPARKRPGENRARGNLDPGARRGRRLSPVARSRH